jgi:hypothetical protein
MGFSKIKVLREVMNTAPILMSDLHHRRNGAPELDETSIDENGLSGPHFEGAQLPPGLDHLAILASQITRYEL